MDLKVLRWARVFQPLIPIGKHLSASSLYVGDLYNAGYGWEYGTSHGDSRESATSTARKGMGYGDGDWCGARHTGDGQGVGRGNGNFQYGGDGRVPHS